MVVLSQFVKPKILANHAFPKVLRIFIHSTSVVL